MKKKIITCDICGSKAAHEDFSCQVVSVKKGESSYLHSTAIDICLDCLKHMLEGDYVFFDREKDIYFFKDKENKRWKCENCGKELGPVDIRYAEKGIMFSAPYLSDEEEILLSNEKFEANESIGEWHCRHCNRIIDKDYAEIIEYLKKVIKTEEEDEV